MEGKDSQLAEQSDHNPDPLVLGLTPQHLAYVIYTSGSTGQPKGVMNEHRAVVNRLLWAQATHLLDESDHVLQKTPFSFDVSVWEFFWPLLSGSRLVIARPGGHQDPDYIAQVIQRETITTIHFVPSMLQVFLDHVDGSRSDALRRVICSGETLPVALQARFIRQLPKVELHNLYGPTEAAVDVTSWNCSSSPREPVPIGRPIANTKVHILDSRGMRMPIGVWGELHIGGVAVARGYLNRPQLTAERFIEDPFEAGGRLYRTGDLGRYRADGSIEYLGRNDHQVKIRGFRIELGEIEAQLNRCEGVREAVVIAREDVPGEKRLVGYVVAQEGRALTVAQMRSRLQEALPEHMVPAGIVQLEALPLTPNGKLDREALPAPDEAAIPTRTYEAPTNDVEKILARLWEQVLRVSRIGVNDNFFEAGGDSIRSITLIAAANKYGLTFTVVDLFKNPTIHRLAKIAVRVREASAENSPVLLSESDKQNLPSDVEDAYGVTLLQRGMIFESRNSKEGVYHDVFTYHLDLPRWDELVLRRALTELTKQHPILRTSFDLDNYSEPLQLVRVHAQVPVGVFDISQMDPNSQQAHIADFVDRERKLGFELSNAPLLRVYIHRRGEKDIQYTLSFHHAVLDGWSIALFQTALFETYVSLLARPDSHRDVSPLKTTPKRSLELEKRALDSPTCKAFWSDYLAESTPVSLPPLDGVMQRGIAYNSRSAKVDPRTRDNLVRIADRLGVPLRTVLLSAHMRVLAAVSGGDDVITGLVCNVRPEEADGDKLLGLFLNTLPFRQKLESRSWIETIRATFDAELLVAKNRHYPYFQIYLDNQRKRVFDVIFNYVNFHAYESLQGPGGVVVLDQRTFAATSFALGISFNHLFGNLAIEVKSDPSHLSAEQTDRMLGYYLTILEKIANDPQARALDCSVLSEAEIARLLQEFNAPTFERSADAKLIQQIFEDQVSAHPDALALVCQNEKLTFRELNRLSNRIAHRLLQLGVRPDDRVAICVERRLELIVGMLGILKAGGAYVPLDPSHPPERRRYILEDSSPVAVLAQSSLSGDDAFAGTGITVIIVDEAAAVELTGQRDDNPNPAMLGLASGHLAYVIYTSGSTGRPKGVMVEHASVLNLWSGLRRAIFFDCPTHSNIAMNAPLSFDASVKMWVQLLSGHCLFLVPDAIRAQPSDLLSFFARHRIDVLDCTPLQLEALLAYGLATSNGYRPKIVLIGGEQIRQVTWSHLANDSGPTRWFNVYGPTECTVDATACCINEAGGDKPRIGRPVANARVYIVDSRGQPVPPGVTGEIWLGGAGVARGYLNRPELTAERFIADPFCRDAGARLYKTGDLGRYTPGGSIEYVGRNDDQVKIRGFRVELGEVENQLSLCAGVREAAVIAREDATGQKRLVGCVVGGNASVLSAAELRGQLARTLPDHMVPAEIRVLAAMPLTLNGKLNRAALSAPDLAEIAPRVYEAPCGAVENAIAEVWQEVLDVRRVGRYDNFFELGGHSLLLAQVIERLERRGVSVDVREVFTASTLSALAGVIEGRGAAAAFVPSSLIPTRAEQSSDVQTEEFRI